MKTIKDFSSSKDDKSRMCHRICWLKNRKFTDRYADLMFGGGEKLKNQIIKIKPTKDLSNNETD